MAVPAILKDNLSIPVIGSPLFIISNPDLVIAQCKAGVIGSFPALNARPEPVLEEWLDRITSELKDHDKNNPDNKAAPFAVCLLYTSPSPRDGLLSRMPSSA